MWKLQNDCSVSYKLRILQVNGEFTNLIESNWIGRKASLWRTDIEYLFDLDYPDRFGESFNGQKIVGTAFREESGCSSVYRCKWVSSKRSPIPLCNGFASTAGVIICHAYSTPELKSSCLIWGLNFALILLFYTKQVYAWHDLSPLGHWGRSAKTLKDKKFFLLEL